MRQQLVVALANTLRMDKEAGLNQLNVLNYQKKMVKKLSDLNAKPNDTYAVKAYKNILRYQNKPMINARAKKDIKKYWDITSGKGGYSVAADRYAATLPRFSNDLIRTQYKKEILRARKNRVRFNNIRKLSSK